jgi:hypothetical protein
MYVREVVMASKLTLRLDDEFINLAKERSRRTGQSVSRMVADYFAAISREPTGDELPPVVSSLKGIVRGKQVDEEDYRRHLEVRHLGGGSYRPKVLGLSLAMGITRLTGVPSTAPSKTTIRPPQRTDRGVAGLTYYYGRTRPPGLLGPP